MGISVAVTTASALSAARRLEPPDQPCDTPDNLGKYGLLLRFRAGAVGLPCEPPGAFRGEKYGS
jgi:hypothetical protein